MNRIMNILAGAVFAVSAQVATAEVAPPSTPLAVHTASTAATGPTRQGYVAVTTDGIRVGVVDKVMPRRNGMTTVIITMDRRIPSPVRKFSVPVTRHMRGDGLLLLDQSEGDLLRALHTQTGI
ncbi:MAG TPA: hypothetical protein DEF16_01335 [Gemmobacter sp.]|nr:MAG: hypothetical protein A2X69_02225 [Rhodobacteraceae bacterium GWF1_65_7]HBD91469.1 hypothetical protein [Gemmobacter sp.]HBU13637.1 hypothetical protein [Gemmobacter sp.]